MADPPPSSLPNPGHFGLDSTQAYGHLGIQFNQAEAYGPEERAWGLDNALQGLIQVHAYRLAGRLGAAAFFSQTPSSGTGSGTRLTRGHLRVGEASLRWRFGGTEADDGIQIGLTPLQGNADAILFGNYLARYSPYPTVEARKPAAWDSLGTLAPRVEGIRLALGSGAGPVRAESWIVKDQDENEVDAKFSLLVFLAGRAPRKVEWGLGLSAYRAFSMPPSHSIDQPGKSCSTPCDSSGILIVDSIQADTVKIPAMHTPILISARTSVDIAALFAADAPEGRYGGLFAEAALLGWENNSFYAPDRSRRIAWTMGARLPTFGLLDLCMVQGEWRIKTETVYVLSILTGIPIPGFPPAAP
ncbi:MAG: hypothetical protein JF616_22200, partial [Fibrobacteres bacterium]|nr:hypothetical protein [Fibrobacterota bacterium]